jgi:hypothetical protein
MSSSLLRKEGGYWKPVLDHEPWEETPPAEARTALSGSAEACEPAARHDLCESCGAEFVVDSPFCRMCGHRRGEAAPVHSDRTWRNLELHRLGARFGLRVGALISLFVGLLCVTAALATGLIYSAATLVDWQAIQIWRMEWLLAAAVAFLCGILLNSRKGRQN